MDALVNLTFPCLTSSLSRRVRFNFLAAYDSTHRTPGSWSLQTQFSVHFNQATQTSQPS